MSAKEIKQEVNQDYKMFVRILAYKIRKYRIDHGLSQKALAEQIGADHTFISTVENGKITITTFKDRYSLTAYMLFKLVRGCGLSVDDMMAGKL